MSKFRLMPRLLTLLIASTAGLLFAMSVMADNSVAPGGGSLGTLRNGEMPALHSQQTYSSQPYASDDSLQPVEVGNVKYITGGIGDEERNTLQSVEKDYNLRIMSAYKDGAFSGDTHVIIRDHAGGELINVSAGPLFYARLPAGTYMVEAVNGDESKKQKVLLNQSKATSVHFSWQ